MYMRSFLASTMETDTRIEDKNDPSEERLPYFRLCARKLGNGCLPYKEHIVNGSNHCTKA